MKKLENNVLGLKINNKVYDINKEYTENDKVQIIDINCEQGYYIYRRTLFLIMTTAFYRLFKDFKVKIHRSINKSTYCHVYCDILFGEQQINMLKQEMSKIISEDRDIKYENGKCTIDGEMIEFGGILATHTGVINKFDIVSREGGFVLLYPNYTTNGEVSPYSRSEHLMKAIDEYALWSDILGVSEVSDINKKIENNESCNMINIQETLHNNKISQIADRIKILQPNVKVILITGPSSSGKTTFSRKLSVNLKANGMHPINISLDNYYHERHKIPKNPDGTYNVEDLEAIDYELFNLHLSKLIKREEVEIPIYNFKKSTREQEGQKIKLQEGGVLIVEGIHALNEKLSYLIDTKNKFKIYCSPLADLNVNDYYPVATSDVRLVRRLVRDYKYRNSSIENTFSMWQGVQKGEVKNIFKYDEVADFIFNTALIYEFSIFKQYIMPLLTEVTRESVYFSETQRLIKLFQKFDYMDSTYVPSTSLLREFIGGSSYKD